MALSLSPSKKLKIQPRTWSFSWSLSRDGSDKHSQCKINKCEECLQEASWRGLVSRATSAIVEDSWASIHSRWTYEAMADAFYATLFAAQPQLQKLFYRACAGTQMFTSLTAKLLELAKDRDLNNQGFGGIGVRHLRYNVKMSMFKTVGKEFLTVLEELSPPGEFTEEVRSAWAELWVKGSQMFQDYLDVDPAVRSVERGHLDELKKLLAVTPRNQRISRLLKKIVDGQSPLSRAIIAHKVNIVRFIVSDLLTIRSDRTGFYFGRDELFDAHPDVVSLLVDHCPEAICDLLDGLVWESAHTEHGYRRVIYYFEGLYGRPETPASKTPLAALLQLEDNSSFNHHFTIALIHTKWKQFGRRLFLYKQGYGLVTLTFFCIGYIDLENSRTSVRLPVKAVVWVMAAWTLYETFAHLGLFRYSTLKTVCGVRKGLIRPVWRMLRDTVLEGKWLSGVPSLLVFAVVAFDPVWSKTTKDSDLEHIFVGITVTVLSIRLLRSFLLFPKLAALTYIIEKMVMDLFKFFCVFIFIWVAFGLGFYVLLGTQGEVEFQTVWSSMISLFGMVFGFFDYEFRGRKDPVGITATLMWLIYVIFVLLVMINLLIAQFASSYERIQKSARAFTLRMIVNELLTMESAMSTKDRQKLWDAMGFDRQLVYDEGVPGPKGGVEVMEHVRARLQPEADPKSTVKEGEKFNRVLHYTDRGDPGDPWPQWAYEEKDVFTPSESQLATPTKGLSKAG